MIRGAAKYQVAWIAGLLLGLLPARAAEPGSKMPPRAGAAEAAPGTILASGPSPALLPAPVTDADFYDDGAPDPAKVELGRLLFFDKELSGNQNISCATCHHGLTDTGDGLSLPLGEGGRGLGMARSPGDPLLDGVLERVPRNAPPVFNLGARQFKRMFHDGRVEVDPSQPSGFRTPAGDLLPTDPPLDNVLAAQAMFPVTSNTEMAGQAGENAIGTAAALGDLVTVWELLEGRLRLIGEYVDHFVAVFSDVHTADDLRMVHVANAIAAFEASAWRADGSPFDRLLRGEPGALSAGARRGLQLFYGTARCASCHSGPFLTDHEFHAIAMPQIGPGKGDGASGHEDFGRQRVTGSTVDRFRFRTPSLRNVALTGPWGHVGAYDDLRAMLEHHLDPEAALMSYVTGQAALPPRADLDAVDYYVMSDPALVQAIRDANELVPVLLDEPEKDDLIEFLHALTDPASLDLRADVPFSVPSGLPLAD